jgi:hypothetical protein
MPGPNPLQPLDPGTIRFITCLRVDFPSPRIDRWRCRNRPRRSACTWHNRRWCGGARWQILIWNGVGRRRVCRTRRPGCRAWRSYAACARSRRSRSRIRVGRRRRVIVTRRRVVVSSRSCCRCRVSRRGLDKPAPEQAEREPPPNRCVIGLRRRGVNRVRSRCVIVIGHGRGPAIHPSASSRRVRIVVSRPRRRGSPRNCSRRLVAGRHCGRSLLHD